MKNNLKELYDKVMSLMQEAAKDIVDVRIDTNTLYNLTTHNYLMEQTKTVLLPLPKEHWIEGFSDFSYESQLQWPWMTTYCYCTDVIAPPFVPHHLLFFGYVLVDDELFKTAFYVNEEGTGVMDPLALQHSSEPTCYIGVPVLHVEHIRNFIPMKKFPLEAYVEELAQPKEEKRPTFADLKKIAEKTGIELSTLQKEYGVYEFSFTTCAQAVEYNPYGYKSQLFFSSDVDYSQPEIKAFHKAWKELSLQEQPAVTSLNFEESLAFLGACYPHGEQFISLLETIEKHIGTDLEKISLFVSNYQRNTFYSHDECPVVALSQRLMDYVNAHYLKKIGETKGLANLQAIHQEACNYKFEEYRPWPSFFDVLSKRIVWSMNTLDELFENDWWPNLKAKRWRELKDNLPLSQKLNYLEKILLLVWQQGDGWSPKEYSLMRALEQFFCECTTLDEAKILLDVGRIFFSNDKDSVYDMYTYANQRIIKATYPHPKLADYRSMYDKACVKSRHQEHIVEAWKKASKKALTQPIPDFPLLYTKVHVDYKWQLLEIWTNWGEKQLEGVNTWEDLTAFDMCVLPNPLPNFNTRYNVQFKAQKNPFSAFRLLLQKLISAAPTLSAVCDVRSFIMKYERAQSHVPGFYGYQFLEEMYAATKKITEMNPSLELLWQLYDQNREVTQPYYLNKNYHELVIDEILKRDASAITKIMEGLKGGEDSNPLYKKYMKKMVELSL